MKPTLAIILSVVAKEFTVPEACLISYNRTTQVADARSAFYATSRKAGWSTLKIGRFLGRNHMAVICGSRKALNLADVYPDFRGHLEATMRITETNQ